MTAPTVVKVLMSPAREPLDSYVRRVVELSDATTRMEHWDYTRRGWVEGDDDYWAFANSFVLGDADLRKLGIPPDPVCAGVAPGGC